MNKRCIVNVATGDFYCKMQERLRNSFKNSVDYMLFIGGKGEPIPISRHKGKDIDLLFWYNTLPTGSRPHSESPYGFKAHAFKAAYDMGYTSILWLDSPAQAVAKDISPIFDKIEKEGYYAMSHIDPLENYVGDSALSVYGWNRDKLKGYNLPSGSCYGFYIFYPEPKNPVLSERGLFWDFYLQEADGMFKSEVNGNIVHRHDEAVLALILLKRNLPVFTFDPLFQSPEPECVIRSGGFVDLTPNI